EPQSQGRRENEKQRQAAWQSALLNASREALILVDVRGEIGGLSERAPELLRGTPEQLGAQAGRGSARGPLLDFFGIRDRPRLQTWLQHVLRDRTANNDEPSCEAELKNGMRVRLQLIVGRDGCAAVALSPLPDVDAASRRDDEEARLLGLVEWLEEGV